MGVDCAELHALPLWQAQGLGRHPPGRGAQAADLAAGSGQGGGHRGGGGQIVASLERLGRWGIPRPCCHGMHTPAGAERLLDQQSDLGQSLCELPAGVRDLQADFFVCTLMLVRCRAVATTHRTRVQCELGDVPMGLNDGSLVYCCAL